MQLRRCLRHLLPKKVPWLQGVRPLDETRHVQCPRDKKGAAKKSLGPKKVLACSLLQHVKTASLRQHIKTPRCPWRRRAAISKSKSRVCKGLKWLLQAVAPSPPSCAASPG